MHFKIDWHTTPQEHLQWLSSRDKELGKIMTAKGPIRRRIFPDPLTALLRSIIGQQISAKIHEIIWSRFWTAFGHLSVRQLAKTDAETLRGCGISLKKAGYIKGVAEKFASGELKADALAKLPDAELTALLTKLPGVGPWTVEMLLIFTFLRPNVLSYGDLAIRRGLCRLHGHEKMTKELFRHYYELYSPCATTAGFYLWELAGGQGV